MSNTQIESLNRNIEAAKVLVNHAEALERMRKNKDFNALITTGYLTNEAVRLVHLKGDPQFQTPERQALVNRQIDAIAVFANYLSTVRQLGSQAETSITSDEETLEAIRQEESDE